MARIIYLRRDFEVTFLKLFANIGTMLEYHIDIKLKRTISFHNVQSMPI